MNKRNYLTYSALKQALYEEIQPLFSNHPHILKKWRLSAFTLTEHEQMTERPVDISRSFGVLWYLFAECLFYQMPVSRSMIQSAVRQHGEVIQTILLPFIRQEFPREEAQYSRNGKPIKETIKKGYLYTLMDTEWQLLRETVAKHKIEYNPKGIATFPLLDNKGNTKGICELRPPEKKKNLPAPQQEVWESAIREGVHSLDDLTADLLDMIAYLWLVAPRTHDGYLEFHADDALKLRNIQPRTVRGKNAGYREDDRWNVIKRMVVLTMLCVTLDVKNIEDDIENIEEENRGEFHPLFEGELLFTNTKESSEPTKAYAIKIKPTPFMMRYLQKAKKPFGLVDLHSFGYNPRTQVSHKRLSRYLSWQFKIRSTRKNYAQPFKVKTLLRIMDMRSTLSGEQLRTRFEEALDDLQRDGVIREWNYEGDFDEERVGEKGWIRDYFKQKQVIVLPPERVVEWNANPVLPPSGNQVTKDMMNEIMKISLKNRRLMEEEARLGNEKELSDLPQLIRRRGSKKKVVMSMEQLKKITFQRKPDPIVVTPNTIKTEREKRKLSVRQASKEMGIAHTTLSRFEKGEIVKLTVQSMERVNRWLVSSENGQPVK